MNAGPIGGAPGIADFERLARAALTRLPTPFAQHLEDIVIAVEDFADAETLAAMGIENEWDLTGLYHGQPLTEQSVWDSASMPPRVTLYRQPLLAEWCETGVTLEALITHVVVHEIGHHFGLSDEDMHALEDSVR
ncbi:metallopeptidase family protein [Croceicoccus naphthovorans]|uniref:Neutral zinc metallopeptidase n=1 Tax=Croceicoccus naphthovorans TaxID=1348774 RepID=A0A0G3XI09_9SPHN|nr:metallopeptidase family protein [Croceicoccus naphthovorans]AKM10234.1 neutral zinc metallopeptidase [Croceicoccus naphthovorans]MBB3990502.1 putative Zn-dependent protease with MMP-like domain [Croceicoccus naphthovorans]